MDITGKIKFIGEVQQPSDKFRKRDFVVTDESSQYPQHILIQVTQDRVVLLDDCRVGDEVKVHFNLRGREWTDPQGQVKYFNTIEAWRIEKAKWDRALPRSASKQSQTAGNSTDIEQSQPAQEDDLPF